MYHGFLIQSSIPGHSGCFHLLAIVTSAANEVQMAFLLRVFELPGIFSDVVFLGPVEAKFLV